MFEENKRDPLHAQAGDVAARTMQMLDEQSKDDSETAEALRRYHSAD